MKTKKNDILKCKIAQKDIETTFILEINRLKNNKRNYPI